MGPAAPGRVGRAADAETVGIEAAPAAAAVVARNVRRSMECVMVSILPATGRGMTDQSCVPVHRRALRQARWAQRIVSRMGRRSCFSMWPDRAGVPATRAGPAIDRRTDPLRRPATTTPQRPSLALSGASVRQCCDHTECNRYASNRTIDMRAWERLARRPSADAARSAHRLRERTGMRARAPTRRDHHSDERGGVRSCRCCDERRLPCRRPERRPRIRREPRHRPTEATPCSGWRSGGSSSAGRETRPSRRGSSTGPGS